MASSGKDNKESKEEKKERKEKEKQEKKEKKQEKKELKQEKKELKQESKEVKKKEAKAKFQADLLLRLQACLMFPENNVCSECPERNPTMAVLLLPPPNCNHKSVFGSTIKESKSDKKANKELAGKEKNKEKRKLMGVFCCKRCSSYFMEQGRDICEVKNIKMPDQWTEGTVTALELSGNEVVSAIYEANYNTGILGDYDNITSSCDPRCGPFVHRKYTECDFFCLESYKQYWKCRLNPKKYGTVMSFVATHHRSARSRKKNSNSNNNHLSPTTTMVVATIGKQKHERSNSDPIPLLTLEESDDDDDDDNSSNDDENNNNKDNNNPMDRVRQNRAARTSMSMISQPTDDEPNPAAEYNLGFGGDDDDEEKKDIELHGLGAEEVGPDPSSPKAVSEDLPKIRNSTGTSAHTPRSTRSRASLSKRRSRSVTGLPMGMGTMEVAGGPLSTSRHSRRIVRRGSVGGGAVGGATSNTDSTGTETNLHSPKRSIPKRSRSTHCRGSIRADTASNKDEDGATSNTDSTGTETNLYSPKRSIPKRSRSTHCRGSIRADTASNKDEDGATSNTDSNNEANLHSPKRSIPKLSRSTHCRSSIRANTASNKDEDGRSRRTRSSGRIKSNRKHMPEKDDKQTNNPLEKLYGRRLSSSSPNLEIPSKKDLGYGETDGDARKELLPGNSKPEKDDKQTNHPFEKKYRGKLGGSSPNLGIPSKEDPGYEEIEGETDTGKELLNSKPGNDDKQTNHPFEKKYGGRLAGSLASLVIPSKEDLGCGGTEAATIGEKQSPESNQSKCKPERDCTETEKQGGSSTSLDGLSKEDLGHGDKEGETDGGKKVPPRTKSRRNNERDKTEKRKQRGSSSSLGTPSNEDLGCGDTEAATESGKNLPPRTRSRQKAGRDKTEKRKQRASSSSLGIPSKEDLGYGDTEGANDSGKNLPPRTRSRRKTERDKTEKKKHRGSSSSLGIPSKEDLGYGNTEGETDGGRNLPPRTRSRRKTERDGTEKMKQRGSSSKLAIPSKEDLGYSGTEGETDGGAPKHMPEKDDKQTNHPFEKKYGGRLGGSFANVGIPSKADLGYGETDSGIKIPPSNCKPEKYDKQTSHPFEKKYGGRLGGSFTNVGIPSNEDLGYGDTEESFGCLKREEASNFMQRTQRTRRTSIGGTRLSGAESADFDNRNGSSKSLRPRRTLSMAHGGASEAGDSGRGLKTVSPQKPRHIRRSRSMAHGTDGGETGGDIHGGVSGQGLSPKSRPWRRTLSMAHGTLDSEKTLGSTSHGADSGQCLKTGNTQKPRHMRRSRSMAHGTVECH